MSVFILIVEETGVKKNEVDRNATHAPRRRVLVPNLGLLALAGHDETDEPVERPQGPAVPLVLERTARSRQGPPAVHLREASRAQVHHQVGQEGPSQHDHRPTTKINRFTAFFLLF